MLEPAFTPACGCTGERLLAESAVKVRNSMARLIHHDNHIAQCGESLHKTSA